MGNPGKTIDLTAIPPMGRMLLRAATTRKPSGGMPAFEPLCIRAANITVDQARLQKFNAVCGFSDTGSVPMTYPHIMAFALHMQLMLDPVFPYTPMGAVHVRNRIRQERPLRTDEHLDFEVRLGETTQVEKGHEISLVTEVRAAGELVWDDLSVMLIRKHGSGEKKAKTDSANQPDLDQSVQWQLAANKGREYAAASGDYNPIHLYPLTARLMGFKRQIMHGMWSKSRSIAHLLPPDHSGATGVDVAFKLPIFLPGTVTLLYNTRSDGSDFEMRDAAAEKPHLAGRLDLDKGIGQ